MFKASTSKSRNNEQTKDAKATMSTYTQANKTVMDAINKKSRNSKSKYLSPSKTYAVVTRVNTTKQQRTEADQSFTNLNKLDLKKDDTNKKIFQRILSSIRTKFENEFMKKNYNLGKLNDDITSILCSLPNLQLNWASLNQTIIKVEEKFKHKILALAKDRKVESATAIDLNKVNKLIKSDQAIKKEEVNVVKVEAIPELQTPNFVPQTRTDSPVEKAYLFNNKKKLVELCQLKKEKDDWGINVRKDYDLFLETELKYKQEKAKKIQKFKEELDKQVLEREQINKVLNQNKTKQESELRELVAKGTEVEKNKFEEKRLLQQKCLKILQDDLNTKKTNIKKREEELRTQEANIISHANEIQTKEELNKKVQIDQRKKQLGDLLLENKRNVAQKKEAKEKEMKNDFEMLTKYNQLLEEQEKQRTNQRNALLERMEAKSTDAGKCLEDFRKKELNQEDERIKRDQIEMLEKEKLKQEHNKLKADLTISMVKEVLKRQIEEKKLNISKKKEEDNHFYREVILKEIDLQKEKAQKLKVDQHKKMINYKNELDILATNQSKDRLNKQIGIVKGNSQLQMN